MTPEGAPRLRKTLLVLTGICVAWASLVLVTGGIHVRVAGIAFRSRDPQRALLLLLVLLLVQNWVWPAQFAENVDRAAGALRRHARWIGLAAAAVAGIHAIEYGGSPAGGSDSFGYVSEAYGFARGPLPHPFRLLLTLPFPAGDVMQMPLGYREGPLPHTMVPTYAPGLPLLMVPAIWTFGTIGPYLIVPACAALFVWFTFCLGRCAAGPAAGVAAAVVALTIPVFLFQSAFAMSDVPAGAWWTGALLGATGASRRRIALGGVAAALGLLVRPNLLFLAALLFVWILARTAGRERFVRSALFALPVAIGAGIIAALNTTWYGSPLVSGYGHASDVYALQYIVPNLQRYPEWLWQSQSGWILLALVSLVALARQWPQRGVVLMCWVLFLATVLSYLPYAPFEEWWYLRFLLPGLGAFAVLIAVGLAAGQSYLPRAWRKLAAAAAVILIVHHTISFAREKGIFGQLRRSEHRYADIGDVIHQRLPENAVVFAMQHSGSARMFGGRLTLRYDFVEPEWATRVIPELEREGFHPYLAVDDWETPDVARHFHVTPGARLPWPVIARMAENGGVSVFDLATHPLPVGPPIAVEPDSAPRFLPPREIVLRPAALR